LSMRLDGVPYFEDTEVTLDENDAPEDVFNMFQFEDDGLEDDLDDLINKLSNLKGNDNTSENQTRNKKWRESIKIIIDDDKLELRVEKKINNELNVSDMNVKVEEFHEVPIKEENFF